jgi:hypothetical protein
MHAHAEPAPSLDRRFLLALCLALAAGAAEPAAGAELDVPCDAPSLFQAMAEANANGEEDVLYLSAECAYVLPETLVVEADAGSPLTIQGERAILSGSIAHTVIRVEAGASLHLDQATVRDGVGLGVQAGGIQSHGALRLSRSTVSANDAQSAGGGILLADQSGATLELVNSTLLGNSAPFGGAIYVGLGATATLVNSTLTGNIGTHGAGIFALGDLDFRNSIVANSFPGVDCSYVGFPVVEASGGNLIEQDACVVPGALSGDPMLGIPVGNPTFYPLLPGSPAIDAGGNDVCAAVDQRSLTRPRDGDHDGEAVCDLGAVEKPRAACGLLGIEPFLILPFAGPLARRARGAARAGGPGSASEPRRGPPRPGR